jgi:SsrA-binding protein
MKLISSNKKAEHLYFIVDTMEAGIVLRGTEVKSLRAGKASLQDAYADVRGGELYLYNMHISPYKKATHFNHEPRRPRKLLMHKREIMRLTGKIQEKGYTLVPTKLYFADNGKVKVELSLAKGKKKFDKRHAIAKKDLKRDIRRETKLKNIYR